MRKDTYTGGEHYYIIFKDGTHAVMRETPDFDPENETIYQGAYNECSRYIDDLVINNYEYDLDI